ncbi:alcohol dehydrogenase catalytic domain-containing protein [Streptomonospora nanhaiensis]|uniref:NADPH:quinone reductase-like Zn-dependent oxidoreductase n=1 Tax=Streptomonospora nanhaiensis TaxID=1323731 RepID=A0A853BK91_9ACTN|nr:alcohol dehydrogenase catalytic domain-containing protein [Streptomonospora nanhaiensis]NYI95450.1 NADPH:quinone reductase-like Zn-dependent oxidoreductase [Streptomonospora nanhaiensis]
MERTDRTRPTAGADAGTRAAHAHSADDRTPGTRAVEIVLPGAVGPAGLQVRRRELPPPGAGEVLVRVEATGVSFAEQQMRRGKYFDQPPFPFVPGYDLIGTVTGVGAGVDPAMAGRRYAALTKTGGWASHAVLAAADLVPVPEGLDAAEAETLVVSGVTAWRMLHHVARSAAARPCWCTAPTAVWAPSSSNSPATPGPG